MNAAADLFASSGFTQPSIREIAESASVTIPALYRLFIDKRDIYTHCCHRAARRVNQTLLASYDRSDPSEVILYKSVTRLFNLWLRPNTDVKLMHRVIMDGDYKVIESEVTAFRDSANFKETLRAAKEFSDGDLSLLRLLIVNTFFTMTPNFVDYWESLNFKLTDVEDLPRNVLSVCFPKVDWKVVAGKCRGAV